MGEHSFRPHSGWPARHKIVGDVRGLGLMVGIEIVRDQKSKQSAPEIRNRIVQAAFHRGLCVLGAGENTIRLCPPLLIDAEQADFAVDALDACIADAERAV